MIRREKLAQTAFAEIYRSDHAIDAFAGTVEETEGRHAVTFVEDGAFGLGNGSSDWWLPRASVFVSHPGARYRYTHREGINDVCVTVAFRSGACDAEWRDLAVVPRRTNAAGYLWWRLRNVLSTAEPMEVDAWAGELLNALQTAPVDRLYRDAQLRWYAERVDAARRLLERDFVRQHSLAALASTVGMSPFQFNRIFRQLAGVPPHRYLLRVRLTAARQMLLDGVTVTDACYDAGFASLSHFITTFRRWFGVSPSKMQRDKTHPLRDATRIAGKSFGPPASPPRYTHAPAARRDL